MMGCKRVSCWAVGMACLLCAWAGPGRAADREPSTAGPSAEQAETLSNWQWYSAVSAPPQAPGRWVGFLLEPAQFDKARADLADLRLYDAQDREVPYALQVRTDKDQQQPLQAREFNRHVDPADGAVETTLDLGPGPIENQELRVETSGTNFRRRVRLEGSNDRDEPRKWGILLDKAYVLDFAAHSEYDAQAPSPRVTVDRLHYPPSRFQYLRLRVYPDIGNPDDRPKLESVAVYHTERVAGEYVTRTAGLGPREARPTPDGPGSAWIIDLGGEGVPCQRLTLDVAGLGFVRPFRLETVEENGATSSVTAGELRRRAGSPDGPLTVEFSEITAHRLRLLVTDHRNPPLHVQEVKYTAAARTVIFPGDSHAGAAPKAGAAPLRLYLGNPQAAAPHYDFAANLPAVLQPAPQRVSLQPPVANPTYVPEPKPWTERWPWLVYTALTLAAVILLGILAALARAVIRRHDAAQPQVAAA